MSKKLLREYYELCEGGVCQDLLTEDEKRFVTDGGMILSGKLQQADTENGNGRIYPYKVLSREVKNFKECFSFSYCYLDERGSSDGKS